MLLFRLPSQLYAQGQTEPKFLRFDVTPFLHAAGDKLQCLYSTDNVEIGNQLTVHARNGNAVQLTVPAAAFVVYK